MYTGLIRIETNYFVAGIIVENNIVKDAAPILKWSIGKSIQYVKSYFQKSKKLKSWIKIP